jgi:hypothetical protein
MINLNGYMSNFAMTFASQMLRLLNLLTFL